MKTGSSLLQSILDSHNNLFVYPDEPDFPSLFIKNINNNKSYAQNSENRFLNRLMKGQRLANNLENTKVNQRINLEQLKKDYLEDRVFKSHGTLIQDTFSKLLNNSEYFRRKDIKYFCYKNPFILNVDHKKEVFFREFNEIKNINKNSKMIILVRNPFDVIASLIGHNFRVNNIEKNRLSRLKQVLIQSYCMERTIDNYYKLINNKSVKFVEYEDLIKNNLETVNNILNWLNLQNIDKIHITKLEFKISVETSVKVSNKIYELDNSYAKKNPLNIFESFLLKSFDLNFLKTYYKRNIMNKIFGIFLRKLIRIYKLNNLNFRLW